jgi:putative ABC transport system permease protein
MRSPPRLAALLLRFSIRNAEICEAILGDLEEELATLIGAGSPPRQVRLWYWRAILGLSRRFAFQAFPGAERQPPSSPVQGAGGQAAILEALGQDLAYAFRGLRGIPGLTVASILTLTLGIGANVAMFSIIEPALLRPLPYEEPDRLVLGLGTLEGQEYSQTVSAHDYVDLKDRSTAFESLGAQTAWPWISSLAGGEEPLRLPVGWVSVDFFRTLGIDPVLGRQFSAEEGVPGGPSVAIVSHALWQQNFGGDPEIVGRSVRLDGTPITIVGVMPAGFRIWVDCDVWMPMRLGEAFAADRRYQNFLMIGRLRPGIPLEQARSQADVIAAELAAEFPATNRGEGFRLTDLQEALTRSYRTSLLLLVGAVGLLLLVACGNLAALLLARGFSRQREFSVRVALGASRGRIFRQVLTESLVVSIAGGALGTLAAVGAHGLIVAHLPFDVPAYAPGMGISPLMLGFVLLLSVGTGVLIGVIPGLRFARRDATKGLKAGARAVDTQGTRIRSSLVVAQVALSFVLLTGSGLLIRSFLHLRNIDPGFDTEGLIATDLELPASEYPDGESRRTLFRSLQERIRAIPGVEEVAMIDRMPIRSAGGNTYVYPVGERPPTDEQARSANERWVMPGYFQAMGIPVLRGRGIEATDGPDAPPVLVINETMAQEFFPGEEPLGKRLYIDFDERTALVVVGVVGDVRFDGPAHEAFQAMYHSYLQEPVLRMEMGIRVVGDGSFVIPGLKEAVRELDPNLPISEVERMDRVIARTMGDQAVMAVVLTFFAWVAALLTALGLYGVLAYYVSQRVPELGLRLALGANPGGLVRMVASRGLGLLALGMVLGIAGALGATRLLQALLVGVEPTDPLTFLLGSAFFVAVGSAASILPAQRAVRIDPVRALQAE